MFVLHIVLGLASVAAAGTQTENYKDQYCIDPRTMRKHAAYTEWADAYSCSRHRCQPGGRNLAIYTVGCKRVEAPESAIECEEVVEDTNMQFPYCCTRLRCLVVVRGEVWTRVLGQPWETLPAAPWSHMYKMKKPPPSDENFVPKNVGAGPIYELQEAENEGHDKVLRSSKKTTTAAPDCNDPIPRVVPSPDIVIALATSNDEKEHKKVESTRHKRVKKPISNNAPYVEEESDRERNEVEFEEAPASERATWTDIPQNQWNEHDPAMDVESQHPVYQPPEEKTEKPSGLQALVDAIGSRMRDIENVVQRMSEKVQKPEETSSSERKSDTEKHHTEERTDHVKEEYRTPKKPNPDNEHYKRFSVKNRGSKYLRSTTEVTSEQPLFVEDTNLNGYFSDASNSVLRRASPKEPAPTYMAPVETRRKSSHTSDLSEEGEKKHKKRSHKKKHKGKGHKKHHTKEDKRKHFNRLTSSELDKNAVSLEDSSAANI